MSTFSAFFGRLRPTVPRVYLLLIAAFAWTIAGGMLLSRGYAMMALQPEMLTLKLLLSVAGGIGFFFLMFRKISGKHIYRIDNLPAERPNAFAFFDRKSYIMMCSMISAGVTLRTTGIVPIVYLAPFYVFMGTPLFLSSLRFYNHFFKKMRSK